MDSEEVKRGNDLREVEPDEPELCDGCGGEKLVRCESCLHGIIYKDFIAMTGPSRCPNCLHPGWIVCPDCEDSDDGPDDEGDFRGDEADYQ